MELGTDWEREALRERWDELERQRRLTDRLVCGASLLGLGILLLLLTVPTEACDHGDGVPGAVCTPVDGSAFVEATIVVLGVSALLFGTWLCLDVLEKRSRLHLVVFGLQ